MHLPLSFLRPPMLPQGTYFVCGHGQNATKAAHVRRGQERGTFLARFGSITAKLYHIFGKMQLFLCQNPAEIKNCPQALNGSRFCCPGSGSACSVFGGWLRRSYRKPAGRCLSSGSGMEVFVHAPSLYGRNKAYRFHDQPYLCLSDKDIVTLVSICPNNATILIV